MLVKSLPRSHTLATRLALGTGLLGLGLLSAVLAAPPRGHPAPRAPAHVYRPPAYVAPRGSVHFAPRAAPRVAPGVGYRGTRGVYHSPYYGSVHFQHHDDWWRRGWWGGVPRYAPDYFRRFRPGWATLSLGGGLYYYYSALPDGCGTVVINDQTYYVCDGIYYVPYFYNGTMVYVAVPPPQ